MLFVFPFTVEEGASMLNEMGNIEVFNGPKVGGCGIAHTTKTRQEDIFLNLVPKENDVPKNMKLFH